MKLLTKIAIVSSVIIGNTILYFSYLNYELHYGKIDTKIWKSDENGINNKRLKIADRIVVQGVLIGKKKEEVIELLGNPTGNGYYKEYDLVYKIGNERGYISIDSEWLAIKINEGKVVSSIIVRD